MKAYKRDGLWGICGLGFRAQVFEGIKGPSCPIKSKASFREYLRLARPTHEVTRPTRPYNPDIGANRKPEIPLIPSSPKFYP